MTIHIPCVYDPAAIWHEDGSASNCAAIAEWQAARQAAIAELTGN